MIQFDDHIFQMGWNHQLEYDECWKHIAESQTYLTGESFMGSFFRAPNVQGFEIECPKIAPNDSST